MYSIPYSRTCVFVVCATHHAHSHARTRRKSDRSSLFECPSQSVTWDPSAALLTRRVHLHSSRSSPERPSRPAAEQNIDVTMFPAIANGRRPMTIVVVLLIGAALAEKGSIEKGIYTAIMTCRIDVNFLNFILSTIKQINIIRGSKLHFIFCRRSISVFSSILWTPKKPLRE